MIWQQILISYIIILTGNVYGRISIIKGKDANIADFPHQVSLRRNNTHFCGGSIISEEHILTAGHCVANIQLPNYDSIIAVSGTSYLDNEHGQRHKIRHVILHPNFFYEGFRSRNDIAIITLKDPITFDIHQNKINLPKHNFKVGDKAMVTGWGFIKERLRKYPTRLQKLETELISTEKCQKKLVNPKKLKIYDTEICTVRRRRSGVCLGDSGGPLTINGELAGIISWIISLNCASKHPDVHTNVYKYKSFIQSVMSYKYG